MRTEEDFKKLIADANSRAPRRHGDNDVDVQTPFAPATVKSNGLKFDMVLPYSSMPPLWGGRWHKKKSDDPSTY